uniref:Splicing factor YJU2 n=1 Tax=Glossina brevipalpis TaxID=37001 RepID=A0A1A9X379_9MUSC
MSERKVLNKYYPPDFDPSKIPRMKLAKNRQYTVRLMAPFNMRCKTCGEYIYKGKKFNARKEDVENETYLNIRIYRFYIKCTRCLQEISFKTDPKNTDYEIEAGATRNFMALKLAEEQARREEEEAREEETNNPMKLLENRTQQSKNEIELLESLEELRDLNRRQETVDYDLMLKQYNGEDKIKRILEMQQKEDEETIKSMRLKHKRLQGDTRILEETIETVETPAKIRKPNTAKMEVSTSQSANRTKKNILSNMIKRKLPDENISKPNMGGPLSLVNYSESSDDTSE